MHSTVQGAGYYELYSSYQNYADTILVCHYLIGIFHYFPTFRLQHVNQNVYRLHAIILSRSPFLAHLMSTSSQATGQRVIFVNLEQEPEVTQEVAICLLYGTLTSNIPFIRALP